NLTHVNPLPFHTLVVHFSQVPKYYYSGTMDGGNVMEFVSDTVVSNLRMVISNLREDGGLMSPSVYDTAQVIRFSPPREGVEQTVEWLLMQQHDDGGWGDPAAPKTRD